jgi:hypothetical protein
MSRGPDLACRAEARSRVEEVRLRVAGTFRRRCGATTFASIHERRLMSPEGIEPSTYRLRERVATIRLCPSRILALKHG